MKTIKTILFVLVLALCVKANAQDKPFTFGVKAGANMSTLTGDYKDSKVRFGYNVGVTVDYAVTENWFVLSGLEYTTKGVNGKKVNGVKSSIGASYIQLPIHAAYKLDIASSTKLVFQAGPYVALGVNGKNKIESSNNTVALSLKENTFGKRMKRFDFGLGLGVGAEFGKINANIGYDFGLLNVAKTQKNEDYKLRNGNAFVTVGYKF